MNATVVCGLGNDLRGDDAAGLLVARALLKLDVQGVDVEEHSGEPDSLVAAMSQHRHVIIVDAVAGDAPPGTVLSRFWNGAAMRGAVSSHGLSVGEALGLARVLGANADVAVYGIVGRVFEIGSPPSVEVVRAAAELAVRIEEDLSCA
ncbi:MAG TPA: hydrogenase maturation protease [Candidatus Dormibacteraeota bacterium]|nr:hydrogenase maturation protease [Candidatus Dormibacteraeota bacterium]